MVFPRLGDFFFHKRIAKNTETCIGEKCSDHIMHKSWQYKKLIFFVFSELDPVILSPGKSSPSTRQVSFIVSWHFFPNDDLVVPLSAAISRCKSGSYGIARSYGKVPPLLLAESYPVLVTSREISLCIR